MFIYAYSPAGMCQCSLGESWWSLASAVRPDLSGSIWARTNIFKLCKKSNLIFGWAAPWGDDEVVSWSLLNPCSNAGGSARCLAVSLAHCRSHTHWLWHVWNRSLSIEQCPMCLCHGISAYIIRKLVEPAWLWDSYFPEAQKEKKGTDNGLPEYSKGFIFWVKAEKSPNAKGQIKATTLSRLFLKNWATSVLMI